MKYFILEKILDFFGLECGWGNGYVIIPEGHPLYGKNYDDIDVDVHGGLTFSRYAKDLDWPEIEKEDRNSWIIGFDTAHFGDNETNWSKENVEEETKRLLKQIESFELRTNK